MKIKKITICLLIVLLSIGLICIGKKQQEQDVESRLKEVMYQYKLTDDLNKKYTIKKNLRSKFSSKDILLIEDEEVQRFMKECLESVD